MFCRSICFFICSFLAAVTATGYSGQVSSTGPDSEFPIHHLRTNNQDSSTSGMAAQLLTAADQHGLPGLKADSEQQMAEQLSVETVAATAVLAVSHSYDTLKKASIDYIRNHIFHVMATQGWADAINTHPEIMIKVMQLVSQSTAETRSLSREEKTRRLMAAAEEGAVGELEALLAAGADVAAREGGEWNATALHWAAWAGHEEAARLLLAAGAAVDARDGLLQWTPLLWAAVRGRAAVVRLLLANGADHGARDGDGNTPLHLAAARGFREAAAALLEAGAYRAARNDRGNTPLDEARRWNQQQLVELLEGNSPTAGTGRKRTLWNS